MFVLPELKYTKDALEPYISAETMNFHYGKHHQTYVDNLNKMIAGTVFENMSLEQIVRETYGKSEHQGIFNNAAQAWNHAFFWNCLRPNGGKPQGKMLAEIEKAFGSYEDFAAAFKKAAVGQFGSGWAWLVHGENGLEIVKTSNADTPIAYGVKPLLTLDVWEHAYYLDYQNRRSDFADAFLAHLAAWPSE